MASFIRVRAAFAPFFFRGAFSLFQVVDLLPPAGIMPKICRKLLNLLAFGRQKTNDYIQRPKFFLMKFIRLNSATGDFYLNVAEIVTIARSADSRFKTLITGANVSYGVMESLEKIMAALGAAVIDPNVENTWSVV
jgi:hypothetical protein